MTRFLLISFLVATMAACATTPTPTAAPSPSAGPGGAPVPTAVPGPGGPSGSPDAESGSPGFVLNEGPATLGCDTLGLDYTSLTWKIDPAAADAVTAVTDTGTALRTFWAPGFTADGAGALLVRGPDGTVVVEDGDQLKVGDQLDGYFVCLGPEKVYVLSQPPQ